MAIKLLIASLATSICLAALPCAAAKAATGSAADFDLTAEIAGSGGRRCKASTESIGGCSVTFKTCRGVGLRAPFTASACASKKCAVSDRFKSATAAQKEAAEKLFALSPACLSPAAAEEASVGLLSAEPEYTCGPFVLQQLSRCDATVQQCTSRSTPAFMTMFKATACAGGVCFTAVTNEDPRIARDNALYELLTKAPACHSPVQRLTTEVDESSVTDIEDAEEGFSIASDASALKAAAKPEYTCGPFVPQQLSRCDATVQQCSSRGTPITLFKATACAGDVCFTAVTDEDPRIARDNALYELLTKAPACRSPAQRLAEIAAAADKSVADV